MGALLLIAAALIVASRFVHVSITTGMMGYMFPVYAVPVMALALVGGRSPRGTFPIDRAALALVVVVSLVAGGWTLVRTDGFSGYIDHDFALRWTKTPEERLLAQANDEPPAPPAAPPPAAAPAQPPRRRPQRPPRPRPRRRPRPCPRPSREVATAARSGRASADPRATASSAA